MKTSTHNKAESKRKLKEKKSINREQFDQPVI